MIPDIATDRLRLVSATPTLLNAELCGYSELGASLDSRVPDDWPVEHYDEHAIRWVLGFLESHPDQAEWSMRYMVRCDVSRRNELVGTCGFKGGPDDGGVVEVGYGLVPSWQKRGLATEATKALIEFAFNHDAVDAVAACTLPDHQPSLGVMKRCGMTFWDRSLDEGMETVRYGIRREEWPIHSH